MTAPWPTPPGGPMPTRAPGAGPSAAAAAPGRWLRRQSTGAAGRMLLVCLPHAGGGAAVYRGWPAHLPHWVDVVGVQYPGRQDRLREPGIGDLAELAAEVAAAVTAAGPRPVALFGHSMGAALAYEVAVRLHLAGRPAVHLVLSGHPPPAERTAGTLHLGTDDELVADLCRLGGRPITDPQLRAAVLPAVRADYRAAETWQPSPPPPLRCRVTVYHGSQDPEVTEAQARGWSAVSAGRFGFRAWPGGHFYLTEHEPSLVSDLGIRLAVHDPVGLP